MPLNPRADRTLVRAAGGSQRFVVLEVQAPESAARASRLPVNLAFVLDRSGSMGGSKIAHARQAVLEGIRSLKAADHFAVVAYDHEITTVVPLTRATPEARIAASRAVSDIEARGQTNLSEGWQTGCALIRGGADQREAAVSRCLLLTDGLANAGVTHQADLVELAAAARERGVSTSTFGVGRDFDEVLLYRMAEAGGGNFHFIETAVQIGDFIASEVGEALEITARDAALVVEAGPGVRVESLNDFPCTQQGGTWRVELGSLFSGQLLHPVLRLTFPEGRAGETRTVRLRAADADAALAGSAPAAGPALAGSALAGKTDAAGPDADAGLRSADADITFTFASHDENDRQPRDRSVDRVVASLFAARAERDALERNRARDYERARQILERCAARIEGYGGEDEELRGIAKGLRGKASLYADDMDVIARKFGFATSVGSIKERYMEGDRRRRRPAGAPIVLLPAPGFAEPVRLALAHVAAASPLLGTADVDEWLGGARILALPTLDPRAERCVCSECDLAAPNAQLRIAFVPQAFSDSWFSHYHADRRTAIVSLHECDGRIAAPVEAFIAYEIALHGLRLVGQGWTPESLLHDEERGCLFDFCAERGAIARKLQHAGLCSSCSQALQQGGVPLDIVKAVTDAIRALARPASIVH